MLAGDDRQGITDVKALHRAPRALEQAITGVGEGDGRAEIALFHARRQNTDHALMPLGVEQAQAIGHRFHRQVLELGQGLALHALFDGFAVLVHAIQLRGHFPCGRKIGGEQAFDAQTHIVQTPGGVEPWPEDEAQVG